MPSLGPRAEEQLRVDLELERRAIPVLNKGIELCRNQAGDNGTAELLEDILEDEEEHANWLEAQLSLVQQVGLHNYLAQQLRDEE